MVIIILIRMMSELKGIMSLAHLLVILAFPSRKIVITIIMSENINDCRYYKNRSWIVLRNISRAGN